MLSRILIGVIVCFFALSGLVFSAERRTVIVDAVAKARNAVVNIRTEKFVQRRNHQFFGFGDSVFDQFFQDLLPSRSYKTQSLGSGVLIDAHGHILTNAHVVDKASKIFVALTDEKRELEAELIGSDDRIDLAVLQIIDKGTYPYIEPARSDDIMLGETVIAIGNPLGLGHSITTGTVSSVKRRIQIDNQLSSVFIQTDALINPGNSGGPLINVNGELIGINTAVARQAQGIGLSIPIDTAKRALNDLITYGQLRHGFLGVLVEDVSANLVRSFGEGGVLIDHVEPGSPAVDSGLQEADVVRSTDDIAVADSDQYRSLMQTYTPDDSLELDILRGTSRLKKMVQLSSLPSGYEMTYTRKIFGFDLEEKSQGLFVANVLFDSPADLIGMKKGDMVARVDGSDIANLTDYKRLIETRLGRKPLTFTIVRDNTVYRIKLP